jgi:starch-binding outer membrane protein, SusD/RagB family
MDLQNAVSYLPNTPLYKTRPSKPAAYAMLSRVYLTMQDYGKALVYADSCLKLYDSLLDYNTLKTNVTYPVPAFSREVIFEATIGDDLYGNGYIVDSNLYKSYATNDLRRTLFFKLNQTGLLNYYGSYSGGGTASSGGSRSFGGIATDEVYLTRAECYARSGNIAAAMSDLNSLMSKRIKSGFFVPLTATTTSDALNLILQERRKETPFRGLRWLDLRRLNSEGANITLSRKVNGQVYTLIPNGPQYVLPIPPDVVNITGMVQNER